MWKNALTRYSETNKRGEEKRKKWKESWSNSGKKWEKKMKKKIILEIKNKWQGIQRRQVSRRCIDERQENNQENESDIKK